MPRRDGTGPMGQGAMTGRGLGNCNDGEIMNSDFGMGRRFNRAKGMGIGFGFGNRNAGMDREYLTEQKSMLQKTLDAIEKQLENLKD